MFWKSDKPWSLANRLACIYIVSTLIILTAITLLLYPSLKELLVLSQASKQPITYALTKICLKKFFVGLWIAAGTTAIISYYLTKHSLQPINEFSNELKSINTHSLEKRLTMNNLPKELCTLANTCNAMLSRIEDSFKHLIQFSTSIAHELRTPLHYLHNATEITLSRPQTIDTYQHVLSSHLEEYLQLKKIIENLLFFSRHEYGHVSLTLEQLSAFHLTNQIVEYYQCLADEKNICIVIQGDAFISVDKALSKRVLSNVLDNAINHSRIGSTITIAIKSHPNNSASIQIIDEGPGIEPHHIPHLGKGFYRPNTDLNAGGLGLGLAIVKSIMALHKGDLTIESQLGIGTSVTLLFTNLDLGSQDLPRSTHPSIR